MLLDIKAIHCRYGALEAVKGVSLGIEHREVDFESGHEVQPSPLSSLRVEESHSLGIKLEQDNESMRLHNLVDKDLFLDG